MGVILGVVSSVLILIGLDKRPGRAVAAAEPTKVLPVVLLAGMGITVMAQISLLVPTMGVVIGAIGYLLLRSEAERRAELQRLQELPIIVEILATRIAMGSTVRGSLGSLTDDQRRVVGMAEVEARIRSGQSVAQALSERPSLVGAALLVTEISGATNPATLERLADRLSSSILDGRAAQSQAGQQLASAAVMALLPPSVSLLYGLSDPRAAEFYVRSPLGSAVIAASLLLSGAGWFWMRFITRPRSIS